MRYAIKVSNISQIASICGTCIWGTGWTTTNSFTEKSSLSKTKTAGSVQQSVFQFLRTL